MLNQNNYKDVRKDVREVFNAFLERKGYRKTTERFSVLGVIYSLKGHFDVEFLHALMKKKEYRISRATIYNTLAILLECDLVVKHQFGKNWIQYEKSFGYKQHDHLICTDCKKIIEFCDPRIQNIQDTIEELFPFEILNHSLVLHATCNKGNCENK